MVELGPIAAFEKVMRVPFLLADGEFATYVLSVKATVMTSGVTAEFIFVSSTFCALISVIGFFRKILYIPCPPPRSGTTIFMGSERKAASMLGLLPLLVY